MMKKKPMKEEIRHSKKNMFDVIKKHQYKRNLDCIKCLMFTKNNKIKVTTNIKKRKQHQYIF